MKDYYVTAFQMGDNIYVRGIRDGKRYREKIPYAPYMFVTTSNDDAEFRTFRDNKKLARIDFDSIKEAKDFVNNYKDVSGMEVHGFDNFLYPYLNDNYQGEVHYDMDLINVLTIDIETKMDVRQIDVIGVPNEITAIGMKLKDKIYALGCKPFRNDDPEQVIYVQCKNETDLLTRFIEIFKAMDVDIITGWNVQFFDIPYLVNRIKMLLGEDAAKKLSPWGMLYEEEINYNNKKCPSYNIRGIEILDYLRLYRKYVPGGRESYALNFIASEEIGEGKHDYSEYDGLDDLYARNFQLYMEYNIQDVRLVDKIDAKLNFIAQTLAVAYVAKCAYQDVYSPIKIWDIIIHNHLMANKIAIPLHPHGAKRDQFAGAFVKDPLIGLHSWVVSFDINSLYPSLIVQYNLSPETFAGKIEKFYKVDELVKGKLKADTNLTKAMHEENCCIAANGTAWTKKEKGTLPIVVERMLEGRKFYKKEMLRCKKEYETNPSKELANDISRNNNMQQALKILLNSLYGGTGNANFRYFSIDFAEAITLSGQYIIQDIGNKMNRYLNNVLKTNKDYVIASDTDSIYLTLGGLVQSIMPNETDTNKIVDFLDKVCSKKLEPYIDKCFDELAADTNSYVNFMKMKRESIADKGIWTAKKRYILNLWDLEGVRYKEPKLKIMGIEAVKSSTPAVSRENIKKALKLIMRTDEKTVQNFIEEFRKTFNTLSFEQISFPRSCNGVTKYTDNSISDGTIFENDEFFDDNYKDKTPIHVRGAIIYNALLEKKGLLGKYTEIQNGDKIKFCYLKTPNAIRENVISVPGDIPEEFDLHKYVDYNMQFEKTFLDPLNTILKAIGWNAEEISTLEAFM